MRTRGAKAAVSHVDNQCRHGSESDVAEQCSEADLLQQYSSIKQLISKNSYAAALQQGWGLLQHVESITSGAERKSRCMQELYVAASLNVVLCSAHVRMPPAIDLAAVNTATWGLVAELRQQPKSAAAPHAGLLYKCLLKITLSVGQQVPQGSPLGSTSELHNNMQELMLSLVAAADLCGQPGLPQQVALKACQQLPPSLQRCMLLALAQAVDAQLSPLTARDSTTSSQSTLVPAPLAALCLQHLASSLRFDISCLESCVSVLADVSEQAEQQATLCLLLTALCRGREAELAASTITQLAAAAHTVAQCLQQHAMQVLSCDPLSCSHSSTTSSCSSISSQGAVPAESSHGGSVTSAADLQLGVLRLQQWCIELAALSGPELLGASCPLVTSTACTAVAALCARGQQLRTATELTAKVVAGAAACLSLCWAQEQQQQSPQRKRGVATDPSTHDRGGKGRACCGHQVGDPDQQCQLGVGTAGTSLQQLSMAVQQLVAWQDLQHHLCGISTAGMTAGGKQHLPAPASVYTWLAQKLHKVVLAAASTREIAAVPSRSSVDNPVAAGLSLMALQCTCAAAVAAAVQPADDGGDSSSDLSAAASSEQQLELSAAALAVRNILQLAKPVLRCAVAHATTSECSSSSGDTLAAAGTTGSCMAAAGAVCCTVPCSHAGVQQALLLGACLMGRLPNWEQQQLEHQWYSTLRSYSRLRCVLATAKQDSLSPVSSVSGSCSSATTGSKPRGRRAGGKAAEPAQNEQPTLQPSGLQDPDNQQCGMRQHQQQLAPLALLASGTAGGLQCPRLDRLYCLEGAALCQVHALAASSGPPVAAAAVSLLQDLAEDAARTGSGRGTLQQAQLLTARGMLLLHLAARQADSTAVCGADPTRQAQAVLLKACQLYDTALQHTPAGSGGRPAAQCQASTGSLAQQSACNRPASHTQNSGAAASSTASKGRSKGAASSSSSRRAAGLKQQQQPQSHSGCSTSRCPAEAGSEGDPSQADTLASAALCHCLLGVVMAQSAQQGHSAAADKQEVALNPAAGPTADPEAGTEELGGAGVRARGASASAVPYDAPLWREVAHHLQQSSALFRHCMALADCASSSSSGASSGASSIVLRYHEEAAAVVMQAWHLAALQGWWELQHTFADTLAFVSGAATQHARQQVNTPLQALQLSSGADWLALLMQPQALPQGQEQHTCSRVSADADVDSAVASSPKSQTEQQLGDVQDDGCQGRQLLDPGGWPGLQHIQQQLAAARMAMNAGDTARAAATAELALQHCRALLKEAGSNTSSTCPRTATSALNVTAARRACVHWHGLGLYMSGIWQLAGVADAAGHPQDAVRMLKELHKLSCSSCCLSFAALAQASISRVYSRWGKHEDAATAVAAAETLVRCMDQQQHQVERTQPQPSAVHALIVAAVAAAAAAVAMNDGQYRNAHEQLCAGVTALQDCQRCTGSQQLGWVVVDQQAQLLLEQARCHVLLHETDLAVAALQHAADVLEAAGRSGQNRDANGEWPVTWAAVQLQLLSLNCPAQGLPHTGTGGGSLALAGFRSGTHSNDLLAEFASAANTGPGRRHPEGHATTSSRGSSTSSRSNMIDAGQPARQRAANRGAGEAGREADPPRLAGKARRTKAPRRPSSSEGEGDLGGDASSVGPTAGAARGSSTAHDSSGPADPVSWLCSMLQAMPLIAQQPLLLKEACGMLCTTFAEYGAVHAAAMFQHMSSGASITQQQLNLATSMLCLGQLEQQAKQPRDQERQATPHLSQPADSHWQQLQVLLSHTSVLQQVADAAQHAVSAADPSTVLQGLVSAVDSAAAQWLRSKLEKLPTGTAVCSISRQQASGGAGGLLTQQQEHHAASTAADTLLCDGLFVSRVMLDGSGKLAVPLLVQLPRPSASASQREAGVCTLLDDLHRVLADASATMADSSSCLDTTAGKARWWKQRLDQDKRIAGVLQQLDQQWLGPWRCLLMQPGPPAVEAAAAEASQAFVAEQFDCVLDERACQLLSQVVVLLLVHFNTLTTAELASALQDLSNLSQQRVDGFHLQQLLSELEAAHAAVSKAAAGTQEAAVAGLCIKTPGSALQGSPAASRKPRVSAAAVAGATAAPLTPLDGAATARRPVARSRGRALQAAPGMSAGGADTTCKAAASGEVPVVQVPQSIARHASRRSRLRVMNDSPSSSRQQAGAASRLPPVGRQAVPEAGPGCFDGSAAACSTPAPSRAGRAGRCTAVSAAVAAEQDCAERQGPSSSSGGASSSAGPVQAAANARGRGPMQWRPAVVLVLDDSTQQLPWESCQGLKGQNIYRCPGLAYAAALSVRVQVAALQGADQLLRLSRSFYLLNPDGDLAATQQTLQETLEQMCQQGVAGSRPAANHLMAALQQHDLFLYFGHGAAEQCLPLSALRRLDSCAAALLMGCSSGRLRPAGQYEAAGPVWSYLMAGCPATVANLWDVTDRDIDRFAASLLQCWAEGSSDSATGGADTSSCTKKHTGSVAAAVVDGSSQGTCGAHDVSISVSVSSSRQACRLPHLIGSAAVCYGLPNCTIGH